MGVVGINNYLTLVAFDLQTEYRWINFLALVCVPPFVVVVVCLFVVVVVVVFDSCCCCCLFVCLFGVCVCVCVCV